MLSPNFLRIFIVFSSSFESIKIVILFHFECFIFVKSPFLVYVYWELFDLSSYPKSFLVMSVFSLVVLFLRSKRMIDFLAILWGGIPISI